MAGSVERFEQILEEQGLAGRVVRLEQNTRTAELAAQALQGLRQGLLHYVRHAVRFPQAATARLSRGQRCKEVKGKSMLWP